MARAKKTYYDMIGAEPDAATVRRLAENTTPALLSEAIREATKALAGPLSDGERAMLVIERKEFRAALALIAAASQQEKP